MDAVGLTFTEKQDFGFLGLQQVGTDFDVSEYTLAWADNAGGRLFRTDGLAGIVNQWQFFTGTTAANATQKFRVFTTVDCVATPTAPAANITIISQNITLEASQRDMIFNAGGNVERMRICPYLVRISIKNQTNFLFQHLVLLQFAESHKYLYSRLPSQFFQFAKYLNPNHTKVLLGSNPFRFVNVLDFVQTFEERYYRDNKAHAN